MKTKHYIWSILLLAMPVLSGCADTDGEFTSSEESTTKNMFMALTLKNPALKTRQSTAVTQADEKADGSHFRGISDLVILPFSAGPTGSDCIAANDVVLGGKIGVDETLADLYHDAAGTKGSPNDKYFAYKAHETSHVFEGNIGYDFGPLAINWYTNFAGNDGVNKDGDRAYSSYVELAAPFKLASLDWTATVGAVPYRTSFYAKANGFAVTNLGLKACKDIEITNSFSVPVFAGVYANPSTQKAYFVCGFTLHP